MSVTNIIPLLFSTMSLYVSLFVAMMARSASTLLSLMMAATTKAIASFVDVASTYKQHGALQLSITFCFSFSRPASRMLVFNLILLGPEAHCSQYTELLVMPLFLSCSICAFILLVSSSISLAVIHPSSNFNAMIWCSYSKRNVLHSVSFRISSAHSLSKSFSFG